MPSVEASNDTRGKPDEAETAGRCAFVEKLALFIWIPRSVLFQLEDEWLVTYRDRKRVAFTTREQTEQSAFQAADAMASSGRAVFRAHLAVWTGDPRAASNDPAPGRPSGLRSSVTPR